MKVALYLRVSTHQQTTENQKIELESYCKRQDWTIAKVYDDSGISGSKFNRPALQEMLKDATKGKFQIVACYKIDRMARSTIDLLHILTQLKNAGVDFVSVTQAINTSSSAGRMLVSFLGAVAEFERDTIIDRVKSGLHRARLNGIILGRPRIEVDAQEVRRLRDSGLSLRAIAKQLGVGVGTIHRALSGVPKTPSK